MLSAEGIYRSLKAAFEFDAEVGFRAYVRGRSATKWVIAADFVTSGSERINDAFAFTVFPYEEQDIENMLSDVRASMPADIKRVRHVRPKATAFLADRRRFHFCFVPDRERHQLGSWKITQDAVAEAADQARRWPESDSKSYYIRKFDMLIQRAKKASFNYPLLHDITLLATLGAYIALLITKHSYSEIIMWAFDRDSMTIAFDRIVYDFACVNFNSLCDMESIPNYRRTRVSSAVDLDNGKSAWFDDLIRLPDHIAGALAQWDFQKPLATAVKPKIAEVIESTVSENPNLLIFRLRFSIFGSWCSKVRVFNYENTNRTAYNNKPMDIVDYLAWTVLCKVKNGHTTFKCNITSTTAYTKIGLRI